MVVLGSLSPSGQQVTAVDGGTASITADYSFANVYPQPGTRCVCEPDGTNSDVTSSATCTVRKPTFLLRTFLSVSDSGTCSGNSCQTLLAYRVLDQNGSPILRAGMQIQESVSPDQNYCNAQIIDSSRWTTDASGVMTDVDEVHICCNPGQNCLFTDDQRFTVNQYPVLVTWDPLNGPTGTHNHIQMTCNNGHGTCAVITPTPRAGSVSEG